MLQDIFLLLPVATLLIMQHVYHEANFVIKLIASFIVQHFEDVLYLDLLEFCPNPFLRYFIVLIFLAVFIPSNLYECSVLAKKNGLGRKALRN